MASPLAEAAAAAAAPASAPAEITTTGKLTPEYVQLNLYHPLAVVLLFNPRMMAQLSLLAFIITMLNLFHLTTCLSLRITNLVILMLS